MRLIPWWAYVGAAVAIFGSGWYVGDAVRAKESAKLRNTAHAEEVARLVRTNEDNAQRIDELRAFVDLAATRNAELRLKLEKQAGQVVIRELWRERERETNAECRAWLDAPVPCKLRPGEAGSGNQGASDVRPAT